MNHKTSNTPYTIHHTPHIHHNTPHTYTIIHHVYHIYHIQPTYSTPHTPPTQKTDDDDDPPPPGIIQESSRLTSTAPLPQPRNTAPTNQASKNSTTTTLAYINGATGAQSGTTRALAPLPPTICCLVHTRFVSSWGAPHRRAVAPVTLHIQSCTYSALRSSAASLPKSLIPHKPRSLSI